MEYYEGRQRSFKPINQPFFKMRKTAMRLLIFNTSSAALSTWFRERRTVQ
jgi:hypothetical protein